MQLKTNLNKTVVLFSFIFMFYTIVIEAQVMEYFTKTYNSNNQKNENFNLIQSKVIILDNKISKIFDFKIETTGIYYLNAFGLGAKIENNYSNFDIFLDKSSNPIGIINFTNTGWQNKSLYNDDNKELVSIKLDAGIHSITFTTQTPYVPMIENINLSQNPDDFNFDQNNYNKFLTTLENKKLPDNYNDLKKHNELGKINTLWEHFEYRWLLDMDYNYTFRNLFYLTSGQNVTFETINDDPNSSDPVMYLYNRTDPELYGSWFDDDGGSGYQSKITCTITHTGFYILLVRAYYSEYPGTSDLQFGSYYASNIPIAGAKASSSLQKSGELNYFTSQIGNGDTYLCLVGPSGTVQCYNDDYSGTGNFDWGDASRIKKNFSSGQCPNTVIVSSPTPLSPTGTCDLYVKCSNSTLMTDFLNYFPNYDTDDAIESYNGQYNTVYNCASWVGGIIDEVEWPPEVGSPWRDPTSDYHSFCNYLENEPSRYVGAKTFTPPNPFGNPSEDSEVDLWAFGENYTHLSIKKIHGSAVQNPHGYDWESKAGHASNSARVFHPRNALSGASYGYVTDYFRWNGTYSSSSKAKEHLTKSYNRALTFEESVKSGLTKREIIEFNESEKKSLLIMTNQIPQEVINNFNLTYTKWRKTWDLPPLCFQSNPKMFAQSKEYSEIKHLCEKKGTLLWPLLINKFETGDFNVINLLRDLIYEYNQSVMDSIVIESRKEQFTKDGIYIAPSIKSNWMKFFKKLLAIPQNEWGFSSNPEEKKYSTDNSVNTDSMFIAFNYPNPFNPTTQINYYLPEANSVSIKIYDILGKEVVTLEDNCIKQNGWHNIVWNGKSQYGQSVSVGTYFVFLSTPNDSKVIKISLIK